MKTKNPTHTQNLMLVGMRTQPCGAVLRKIKNISTQLGQTKSVLVAPLNASESYSQIQLARAKRIYAKAGLSVERLATLPEIASLAKEKTPPVVILGASCPFGLQKAIGSHKLGKALKQIAHKSLLIANTNSAIPLCAGTLFTQQFDKVVGLNRGILSSQRTGKLGLNLLKADVLPIGKHLAKTIGEHRPDAVAQAYVQQNPFNPVAIMQNGSAIYAPTDNPNDMETIGKVEVYKPTPENRSSIIDTEYSMLNIGGRPLVTNLLGGMI